ncbi:MAG: hypothetical protein JW819_09380 [Candidatus Krumholzibacteriota bacterium]|nr:hypothetical protein [Candidatus Krumholzibacteriota bacterium]
MNPRRRWPLAGLSAIILSIPTLAFGPAAAGPDWRVPPPVELRGRWILHRGGMHAGGTWRLRRPDIRRAALRAALPRRAGLPRAQVLLRDGDALLDWAEPASQASLIRPGDARLELLERLPAAAWAAVLTGEGLADFLEGAERSRESGWDRLEGALGGWPARLRLAPGGRARDLVLESPDGPLRLAWRDVAGGRRRVLDLRLPDGRLLRLTLRPPRARRLAPEAWLFLDGTGAAAGTSRGRRR